LIYSSESCTKHSISGGAKCNDVAEIKNDHCCHDNENLVIAAQNWPQLAYIMYTYSEEYCTKQGVLEVRQFTPVTFF